MQAAPRPGPRNLITDVAGILVGNAEAPEYASGTTVVLPEAPAIAAADVRGGGPGTRELDAIGPDAFNQVAHAVVLSGGSAYGLAAADGVMEVLRDRRIGLALLDALVPIVPTAILFDLPLAADPSAAGSPLPYRALGQAALGNASTDFALGNAGAGLGATTAEVKGGLGSVSLHDPDNGWTIGALAATNPRGSVLIPGTRHFRAALHEWGEEFGGLGLPGKAPHPFAAPAKGLRDAFTPHNTTLVVVATDAALNKAQARRVAIMAQDGIGLAIHP
ncbi:MAG: peptidase S58 family protein, partial [Alphaproteobacteria bacterium]